MLCSGNSELGGVEIKRGIFQGNSLSPKGKGSMGFPKAKRRLIIFYLWMI